MRDDWTRDLEETMQRAEDNRRARERERNKEFLLSVLLVGLVTAAIATKLLGWW